MSGPVEPWENRLFDKWGECFVTFAHIHTPSYDAGPMDEGVVEPKELSPSQKLACAKDFRDISHENVLMSSRRGAELSDEFTRLEVQIATILFGLASLFLGSFNDANLAAFNPLGILLMKLTFALSMFFLVASLISGLLHIKRKEKFWDELMIQKNARFLEWDKVVRKIITFEQGDAYHRGTTVDKGNIVSTPVWTWILQTIFLGLAIASLLMLSLVFLFR
jgi:hypothetical protein